MLEVFTVKDMTMVWLYRLKNPDLNISTENNRRPPGERHQHRGAKSDQKGALRLSMCMCMAGTGSC